MGIFRRFMSWWRGDADPEARTKAKQIQDDVETLRTGSITGAPNVTHLGKDSTGRR
jgi:hypothetical protein